MPPPAPQGVNPVLHELNRLLIANERQYQFITAMLTEAAGFVPVRPTNVRKLKVVKDALRKAAPIHIVSIIGWANTAKALIAVSRQRAQLMATGGI